MRCVRAWDTASGPSIASDRASSGSGTTRADHTVIDRPAPNPPCGRVTGGGGAVARRRPDARRATTLPTAHEVAAATTSTSPSAGVVTARPTATTPSPTAPTSTPTTWGRLGRSRSARAAITTVSPTWACSTSEARPAGIPTASAV